MATTRSTDLCPDTMKSTCFSVKLANDIREPDMLATLGSLSKLMCFVEVTLDDKGWLPNSNHQVVWDIIIPKKNAAHCTFYLTRLEHVPSLVGMATELVTHASTRNILLSRQLKLEDQTVYFGRKHARLDSPDGGIQIVSTIVDVLGQRTS